MLSLLWTLFYTFFVIGLFNFGGGGAMISLIQARVVTEHAWLTEEGFTNIVAISQTTPGPIGINCATYVGFEVMHNAGFSNAVSILGSAATTLAIVLPSFMVFLVIVTLFNRFHESPVFLGTMKALKPVVAGLIAAACLSLIINVDFSGSALPKLSLIETNFPDWKAWVLFVVAFILGYTKKMGPVALLLSAAVLGLVIY